MAAREKFLKTGGIENARATEIRASISELLTVNSRFPWTFHSDWQIEVRFDFWRKRPPINRNVDRLHEKSQWYLVDGYVSNHQSYFLWYHQTEIERKKTYNGDWWYLLKKKNFMAIKKGKNVTFNKIIDVDDLMRYVMYYIWFLNITRYKMFVSRI